MLDSILYTLVELNSGAHFAYSKEDANIYLQDRL
jgi:hypothetical protein